MPETEHLDIPLDLKTLSQDQINEIVIRNLIEIKNSMKPWSDAVTAARTFAKVVSAALVFVSIVLGVIYGFKNIYK